MENSELRMRMTVRDGQHGCLSKFELDTGLKKADIIVIIVDFGPKMFYSLGVEKSASERYGCVRVGIYDWHRHWSSVRRCIR